MAYLNESFVLTHEIEVSDGQVNGGTLLHEVIQGCRMSKVKSPPTCGFQGGHVHSGESEGKAKEHEASRWQSRRSLSSPHHMDTTR